MNYEYTSLITFFKKRLTNFGSKKKWKVQTAVPPRHGTDGGQSITLRNFNLTLSIRTTKLYTGTGVIGITFRQNFTTPLYGQRKNRIGT
jgi:hypothetical protein